MNILVTLLLLISQIYLYIIIASIVLGWLTSFGVINAGNRYVYKAMYLLNRATEPVMSKARKLLPPMGGLDFSPIIVILGITILQKLLISM